MNTSDVEDVSTSKKSRSTPSSKLGELEEQLKLARECRFPSELVDKLAAAEAHKQKDLKRANLVRDLKLREVQAHHEFLVQEASNTFASKKHELQQQYCQEIEDKIKQITGVAPSSAAVPTAAAPTTTSQAQQSSSSKGKPNPRRSRSKSLEDETGNNEDESQPAASNDEEESDEQQQQQAATSASTATTQEKEKPVPKKSLRLLVSKVGANSNLSLDSFVLAGKEDIQSDLELIHANWMKRAAATTTGAESTEVNLCQVQDGNRLVVGPNLVLEKGSLVVVTRRGLDEEIQATITKVSVNEVMIKQVPNEDGGGGLSARIPVSQLKSGRCAIRPALVATATAGPVVVVGGAMASSQ